MAKSVEYDVAIAARKNGVKLGETQPCRETKYSWWEVFYYNGEIIACVMDDENGVVCAEYTKESEIVNYLGDDEAALKILASARQSVV